MERKMADFLFYVAWALFLLSSLLEHTILTIGENADMLLMCMKLVRYIAYGICFIKIVNGRYHRKILLSGIMIGVIFILSYLGSGNRVMCLYLLVLFAAFGIDGRQSIKISYRIQALVLGIFITLSLGGIVTDHIFEPDSRMRHGLGFNWATTAPILYLYIILGYIYIKRENTTCIEYLIMECVNIWLYKMTDTRMAFILSSLFLLFFALEGLFRNRWKYWRRLGMLYCGVPVLLSFFAFFLHWGYDAENEIWSKLNSLLSNRLYLGKNAIATYGISLFGQKIRWVGFSVRRDTVSGVTGYNYVDCSYIQMMLEYGVIFLAIVVGIYTIAVYRAVKEEDWYLVFALLIVLGFGITEPRLMNFAFNPFPLMAFCRLRQPEIERRKEFYLCKSRNH
jgi:hypothetical protein